MDILNFIYITELCLEKISLHSLSAVKTVDQHVQDLIKCQNVCFVLAQQMAEKISKQNKDILLPHKYSETPYTPLIIPFKIV